MDKGPLGAEDSLRELERKMEKAAAGYRGRVDPGKLRQARASMHKIAVESGRAGKSFEELAEEFGRLLRQQAALGERGLLETKVGASGARGERKRAGL